MKKLLAESLEFLKPLDKVFMIDISGINTVDFHINYLLLDNNSTLELFGAFYNDLLMLTFKTFMKRRKLTGNISLNGRTILNVAALLPSDDLKGFEVWDAYIIDIDIDRGITYKLNNVIYTVPYRQLQ